MELNKKEMLYIIGGANSFLSGTFINAIARGINSLLDLGRSFGTAIRRLGSGNLCSIS